MPYEPETDYSLTDDGLARSCITASSPPIGLLGTATSVHTDDSSETNNPARSIQVEPLEAFETPGGGIDVAGRRLVGDGGYETIQDAWDAAADGDTVYVHSSYDARSAGERFPIIIDQREKEVAVTGGHPSGSVIDAEHAPDENVLEVYGAAHHDFRNTPLIRDLTVIGGNIGMMVVGAPNASFARLTFYKTNDHGVLLTTTDEIDRHTFGTRWYSCETWACGGSGFRTDVEAGPHGTSFIGCTAAWNGWNGNHPGVVLRGFSSVWTAGTIQRNSGQGIDLASGSGQVLRDTYFESNGLESEFPVQVYANGTLGLTIDSCYFDGRMMSANSLMGDVTGHSAVKRAITLETARTTSVQNCSTWHHEEGFIGVESSYAEDNDLNLHTHHSIDGIDTLLVRDTGTRTRTNGIIREQDMREVSGKHRGDRGIHDGSGPGPWGPVTWTGSEWRSVIDGQTV